MYKALIIDDESDARGVLQKMLEFFCPEVTSTAEAANGAQALELARNQRFDLAFVDIQLRKESGLKLAESLREYCPDLIFVTAYDDYAVEAFRTSAVHYLLKPVDPEQLREAVTRAVKPRSNQEHPTISLTTKTGILKLPHNAISYVQGDGNYCTFYCTDGSNHVVSKNLAHYAELLDKKKFVRIHQSYLIQIDLVGQYLVNDGYFAILQSGEKLPISRRRKDEFLQALQG